MKNIAVIARPVRRLVVAIPRLMRKVSDNFQIDWDSPRLLVVIVTCFLSTGGLPHQCAHLLRNDRKFGVSASNANLSPHCTVLKKTSPEAGRPPGEWGDSVRRSGGRRRRCRHYRLWPPAGRCSHGTHGQPLSAPVSRSISTGREYPWR